MNEIESFKWEEEGERLKAARKAAGLTQYSLAQTIGVNREVIWRWETGRTWPTLDHLKALVGLYGVSVDWVLGNEKVVCEERAVYNLSSGRAEVANEIKAIVDGAEDAQPVVELRRIRDHVAFMVKQARQTRPEEGGNAEGC